MTARMSKEAEARVVRGVEQVVDLVQAGRRPDDAVIKVARADDYPPGQVRLIIQAYNTGRTNHQRRQGADLFEKTADFPVADAVAIFAALYPRSVKTAAARTRDTIVSTDYLRPPPAPPRLAATLEKAAASLAGPRPAPYPRDSERHAKRAFALLKDLDNERERRRGAVAHLFDKLAACVARLDDYFRRGTGPSLAEVRAGALALWGRPGAAVLDKVAEANPRLAKVAAALGVPGPVDCSREPYSLVGSCVQLAWEHGRVARGRQEFEKAAAATASRLLAAFRPPPPTPPPEPLTGSIMAEKEAWFGMAAAGIPFGVGAELGHSISKEVTPDDKDALRAKALMSLNDPSHESRLRKVRSQAVLHDMMANDEFIAGADPRHVVDIYNQLSQLAPRVADQPMAARALIRRYLGQGAVDPHEVEQLVGVESKLKQQAEPEELSLRLSGLKVPPPLGMGKGPPPEK